MVDISKTNVAGKHRIKHQGSKPVLSSLRQKTTLAPAITTITCIATFIHVPSINLSGSLGDRNVASNGTVREVPPRRDLQVTNSLQKVRVSSNLARRFVTTERTYDAVSRAGTANLNAVAVREKSSAFVCAGEKNGLVAHSSH